MKSIVLHGDWQPIATAPFNRNLELAVLDAQGSHALVFPCRRVADGWVSANSTARVSVNPTHWRDWQEKLTPLCDPSV